MDVCRSWRAVLFVMQVRTRSRNGKMPLIDKMRRMRPQGDLPPVQELGLPETFQNVVGMVCMHAMSVGWITHISLESALCCALLVSIPPPPPAPTPTEVGRNQLLQLVVQYDPVPLDLVLGAVRQWYV